MKKTEMHWSRRTWFLAATCCLALLAGTVALVGRAEKRSAGDPAATFTTQVRPLIARYCLGCHSEKKMKGDLDLERFTSIEQARKDLRPWQAVEEMLVAGEMPPKKSPQPRPEERRRLVRWVRSFLDAEARARAGDPGRVIVRRLSNAEYNNTVRDLTRVDLQPARDFPADGAAGEGFTNAGDALVMSPTLLNKYLKAAKDMAAHAVLLPDGFRFSPSTTRRDWTDEVLAELRSFYGQYTGDGKLPLRPYLTATIRYREELTSGKITLQTVAVREKLNLKYLRILWQALNDKQPSFPLDRIRSRWQKATVRDADAILGEISAWQTSLWKFNPIGSYRDDKTTRQEANNPPFAESPALRLKFKPLPGQREVVLYLVAREFPRGQGGNYVVWHRPRFEGGKPAPLLLKDVARVAGQFEVDHRAVFADAAKHLAATVEAANDGKLSVEALAKKHGVDAALLNRWMTLLDVEPLPGKAPNPRKHVAIPLQLLGNKRNKEQRKPAINGWGNDSTDHLPILLTNSSAKAESIPGTVPARKVVVHPTPTEFAAVAWRSPIEGEVRVEAKITHAHPACGNGIAWWLEHRQGKEGALLGRGLIDVGRKAEARPSTRKIGKGDLVVLAIGARDLNHGCDLTAVELTITETAKPNRVWDLARDVADTVLTGNPHADRLGNKDVWQFVKGRDPTADGKPIVGTSGAAAGFKVPPGSVLAVWRTAASDPKQQPQLSKLAAQVQDLLAGSRPAQEKQPDRLLYDTWTAPDSPLLQGINVDRLMKARTRAKEKEPQEKARFGLDRALFGKHPLRKPAEEASLVVPVNSVREIRLPALLVRDREFVVEGKSDPSSAGSVVQLQVLTAPPPPDAPLDGKAPCVASPGSAASKQLKKGLDDFRRSFPIFICYPHVIPVDEVICLKLYHREDDELSRFFLDDAQTKRLDRLWEELRFISQYPVTEHQQLPQFIGYVTQDQPKELVAFFESKREPFRKRAEEFQKEVEKAAPQQLNALAEFASRAYRRPLQETEKTGFTRLYQVLRKKGLPHEEAFRTVLTRVLISPAFLFRIEEPATGPDARPVSNWELATRLSYALWASMPDAELRRVATAGQLHDPKILSAQVTRMLRDPKVRGLAVEFGTQWLHVRDIRDNREKNEKLFPTFDDKLRQALYEESALFFQDLFQSDRPVQQLLDSDATFLNDTLAKHYGIPNVTGPQWRRVTGVKKYGRGGILALASVLTKQSGASRTSPVLRGNWLVETLLGEKLPKPPASVPRLPESETGTGLSVRQLVEKHARAPECAVCHKRIDPFGFALERYDPIGRLRDKDLGGRPIDTKARLKDGTKFDGIDGLRQYLLTQRKDVLLRHFCKKLVGYALGRSVTLSDQPLLDDMLQAMKKNDNRVSAAVQTIVRSKQFRYHRGLEATKEEN